MQNAPKIYRAFSVGSSQVSGSLSRSLSTIVNFFYSDDAKIGSTRIKALEQSVPGDDVQVEKLAAVNPHKGHDGGHPTLHMPNVKYTMGRVEEFDEILRRRSVNEIVRNKLDLNSIDVDAYSKKFIINPKVESIFSSEKMAILAMRKFIQTNKSKLCKILDDLKHKKPKGSPVFAFEIEMEEYAGFSYKYDVKLGQPIFEGFSKKVKIVLGVDALDGLYLKTIYPIGGAKGGAEFPPMIYVEPETSLMLYKEDAKYQ